ncbi:MAG: class I SAM-dependent methyltransferase [Caldilineales bacterium]|nr:class I SAM-dependent methyltransferase [Caldilineales bacterium]
MNSVSWTHVRCNQCNADDARLLVQDIVHRQGQAYRFDIVQCRQCGLIYTNPRGKSELFDNLQGGGAWQNAAVVNQGIYTVGVRNILHHLPANQPVRLLDIGSAYGDFLDFAQKAGWQAEGVEINPGSAPVSRERGFTVYEGYLGQLGLPESSFDVITMWDVIEHLDAPKEFLAAALPLLRPGGLLFFHTGNADFQIPKARLLRRLFPDRGPLVASHQHIYHFDPASALKIAQSAGFEPLVVFSCGTLLYPSRLKRLALRSYNAAAVTIHRLGLPLYTSAMGVLARRP